MTGPSPSDHLKCQSSGDHHSICLLYLSSVFLSNWLLISPLPLSFFLPCPSLSSFPFSAFISRTAYADTYIGLPYSLSLSTVGWSSDATLPGEPIHVKDMNSGTRVALFYESTKILHRQILNTVTPSNFYCCFAKVQYTSLSLGSCTGQAPLTVEFQS